MGDVKEELSERMKQIQKLTELLGEDYIRVFKKQNKPMFRNDSLHETFFKKLKSKNLNFVFF